MKKYFILLLLIGLFGFSFIPNVFADNKVGIKSIELVDKSENTTINSEPKFNNLEMNFDVAFKAKDDYAKYKVVVSNNTSVDYNISENTSFNDSPYVSYKYEVNDELKANDEIVVYVTITYSKEIDSSKLTDGKYSESNKAIVQLLDGNGNTVNPNTSSSIAMILINLFIVLFVSILLLIKFRNKKTIPFVVILGLSLIPITTKAIETLKLTINVNVQIEKGYRVAYLTSWYSLYLTEDELKEWDLSDATCDAILNVMDGSSTKKYRYCQGQHAIIYKSSKLYSSGEKVDLNKIKIRHFDLSEYDSYTGVPKHCSVDLNDSSILNCDSNIKEQLKEINYWYYDKPSLSSHNYPFFETDKDIMNFSAIDHDSWSSEYGYLKLKVPASFTMPDHDVLFVPDILT